MKESESTSTARIKPSRKISEPVHIRFEELEAIREVEEIKQKATTKLQ